MRIKSIAAAILIVTGAIALAGSPAKASSIVGTTKFANGKAMNGVFVSAKRDGSDYTTTVYSDDSGNFKFPDLPDGNYMVRAFARGYKESVRANVAIQKGKSANLSFSLAEETDPVARFNQATAGEWLVSLPGTQAQKDSIDKDCSGCHHNVTQLMKHRFTKDDWLLVMRIMEGMTSANAVFGINEAGAPRGGRSFNMLGPGQWRFGSSDAIASYLAEVQGPNSPIPTIKFYPRPTGKATQAVITAYRIPRYNAAPHDVQLDKHGNVWYNDFKAPYIGKLNIATGEFTDFKIPVPAPLAPGSDNMSVLPHSVDDSVWLHERWAHKMVRFDIQTEKVVATYEDAGADAIDADGKTLLAPETRLDLTTGKVTHIKYNGNTGGYGTAMDSKGMGYRGGISDSAIKQLNPNTGEVTFYQTPTPNSGPRRGCVDQDDDPWFGEWWGGKIAKLDVKTGKVIEYSVSVPFAAFYEVCTDNKNATTWGYDWHNDRLVRVNAKTGEVTEYPMPTLDNESRRTVIDDSTSPPSVWIYGMMSGIIMRVQAP